MPTDHSAFGSSPVQPATVRDLLGVGCPRTIPRSVLLQFSLLLFVICWALDAHGPRRFRFIFRTAYYCSRFVGRWMPRGDGRGQRPFEPFRVRFWFRSAG